MQLKYTNLYQRQPSFDASTRSLMYKNGATINAGDIVIDGDIAWHFKNPPILNTPGIRYTL